MTNIRVSSLNGEAFRDNTPAVFTGEVMPGSFTNSTPNASVPSPTPSPSPTPAPTPSPSGVSSVVLTVQESMMQDVSGDGTIDWVLPTVPKQPSRTKLYINGQKQVYGADFFVSNNIVSWQGYELREGWRVELYYV